MNPFTFTQVRWKAFKWLSIFFVILTILVAVGLESGVTDDILGAHDDETLKYVSAGFVFTTSAFVFIIADSVLAVYPYGQDCHYGYCDINIAGWFFTAVAFVLIAFVLSWPFNVFDDSNGTTKKNKKIMV